MEELEKVMKEKEFFDTMNDLYRIKVILLALWDKQNHPEATEHIEKFREDLKMIDEIMLDLLEK